LLETAEREAVPIDLVVTDIIPIDVTVDPEVDRKVIEVESIVDQDQNHRKEEVAVVVVVEVDIDPDLDPPEEEEEAIPEIKNRIDRDRDQDQDRNLDPEADLREEEEVLPNQEVNHPLIMAEF